MSLTSAELRKLAQLKLSPQQMAGVLELLADRVEADETRKAAQADRKRRSRDKIVTVTGQSQDSHGTIRGQSRDGDVTPSPPSSPPFPLHPLSPPISPPSRAELGSARDLETALREAAGWQSEPAPKLAIIGEIQGLLDNGADLDVDVLPTVRALAPNASSRTSWRYFVRAIAEARDRRISASTVVSLPTSSSRSTSHAAHRQKPSRDETFAAIDRRIAELAEAERRAAGGSQDGLVHPDEGAA